MFSPSPYLTNSGDRGKNFHSQLQFFFSTNILAAEVTTVRLSVDCFGSGRIVLFAPIGRASHHLSRSHFSTWVVKMRPQSNPCCFHSPSGGNASLPECVNKRVGNRSLCAKDDMYENQCLPKKSWSKTRVPPPSLYNTNICTEYMWDPHQGKGLAEFAKIVKYIYMSILIIQKKLATLIWPLWGGPFSSWGQNP